MHLLIDGQALQTSSSRQRGIGRYSRNLLRALVAARPEWRIEIVQNSTLMPIAAEDRNDLPILSFRPPLRPHGEYCELNERYYADWLTARGAEGVLILSHCEGWDAVVPSFHGPCPPIFGIAYDLIPLLFPEYYLGELHTSHWFAHRYRQLMNSDALLAISEATARDVRALGGCEAPLVANIGGAVDPLFAPLSVSELNVRAANLRQRFSLQREFLLYVGAMDYRKNLHGALSAFAALSSDYRAVLDLAVVCRMNTSEEASVRQMARQAGIAADLRLIRAVDDEDLRALYQMCRLFFFPSLYEGLGLPVLEALHCGAPVVTSHSSSLPEYAGSVSWSGDPHSPQAMAHLLQKAMAEPRDARRSEREAFARTFTWQKTAERVCAVMERIVKRPSKSAHRRRRLAWVMPLSPVARDAVEYVTELLPLLRERFDIELIATSEAIEAPENLSREDLILTPGEVAARHTARPYDLFVYLWDPSREAGGQLDLLERFPGLLVLNPCSTMNVQTLLNNKFQKCGKSQANDFAPILGVLVHTIEAWRQMRQKLAVPVIHLERPNSLCGCPPVLPAAYAASFTAWIEQAIQRYAQNDGPWRGFTLQSLADSPEVALSVVASWAKLRTLANQRSRILDENPNFASV